MSRTRTLSNIATPGADVDRVLGHMEEPMSKDPRKNAPPCISALPLIDRKRAMEMRAEVARQSYMRSFQPAPVRPSLLRRVASLIGMAA